MKDKIDGLIKVLLDSGAEFGDRDDAAIDLAYFDDPKAEAVLELIISDEKVDPDLRARCKESLSMIQKRKCKIE